MKKMGPKSRDFCEQTLNLLASNLQMVPPNLSLEEALADRTALEQLRQLLERGEDTEMALGRDMMAIAPEGYRLLDVSGRREVLKSARREVSARFARERRAPTNRLKQ